MMDQLTPRRLHPGEEVAFGHAVTRAFHEEHSEAALAPWLDAVRDASSYRAWVVEDRGAIVGNLGVFATDLSLPGAASLPLAAVTAVGVAQTHRRRGLLRAMMTTCLDEADRAGEPVAALYASESAIYTRYGFGLAGAHVAYHLERAHTRFRDGVDPQLVEAISAHDAVAAFEPVFDGMRARCTSVGRTRAMWRIAFEHDPPEGRDGASAWRLVHVPGRGYAAYRVRPAWEHDLPTGTVEVRDLVATDPEAETALWQHVCDIDLTQTIVAKLRPQDDALPAMLVDPLRTRTTHSAPLYVRVLDVARVFESRRYAGTGRCVLRVHDADRAGTTTWDLDVAPDGAACTPTAADPDLELSIEELSAIWLGGVGVVPLVGARRVVEHTPGAAFRLSGLLAVERAPWTSFEF